MKRSEVTALGRAVKICVCVCVGGGGVAYIDIMKISTP